MVGRDHQTIGMPRALVPQQGKDSGVCGLQEPPTSPPGLRTSHWEGRPQRAPHSRQRRPGDADPAFPSAEREPASGAGGPKASKGRIAAMRLPTPPPSQKTRRDKLVRRSRTIIYLPAGRDPRTKPGRPRGAGQLGGVLGVGANRGAG